jgi:riboflavin kinase/FMN adenylyltransferase
MGDFTTVSSLLGRPYTVTSPVLHGKKIGRTIGHPTINMRLPADKIKPPLGVYSCIADFTDNDGRYIVKRGVCNLGYRPTVNDDESDITLETYLFDFSDDIYGKTVTVYLIEMLRHEQRFSSLDELMLHIEEDVVTARKSLRKYYNEDSE